MRYTEKKILTKNETEPVRRYILDHGVIAAVENYLPVSNRRDAKTTSSVYFDLPDKTEVRISNHSSGIWIGINRRTNTAEKIEISTKWPASRLAVKILSIAAQI